MDAAVDALKKNAALLRRVNRGKGQEDAEIITQGSKMYEVGSCPRLDRAGHMQAPRNLKKSDTNQITKFELVQIADHVLDGVVAVLPFFFFH